MELPEDIDVLKQRYALASTFNLGSGITIAARGDDTWAIVDAGFVFNKSGEWEYEPFPSARTKAFIKRTRYTLDDAFEMAERHAILSPATVEG